MANTNAPYGFRLWRRGTGGTGTAPLGSITIPSAGTFKVGDPVKVSAGLGYLAAGTNATYGIANRPVPSWGEAAITQKSLEVIPCDDTSYFRAQSIGAVNATVGYVGVASKRYRIGGTTSGYTGIDLAHTTGGVLQVLELAPGSAFGTYAEFIVMFVRGAYFGAA
jgi:hypothetical protein